MQVASSERLQYEMVTHKDKHLLFELDQDPKVMRFINGGQPSTIEDIENVILPRLDSYYDPMKGWGLWKVTTLATETFMPATFIGWILVRPMGFFSDTPLFNDLELGWRFKQASWGKGYASEAAKAVSEVLAQQDTVNFLSAVADENNLASINIMKKLGMTYQKTDQYPTPSGDVEVVYYQKTV
ncbi:GNAT family N-acetyltransferase [Shewanella sp. Isolate11]|uniref:GNAT family N-acetyltransferase n=1 Tax=Shewanella sp. Isolate11 TaxID=2908530 RepID=UPI001EFC982C|nr:GNAT family N-acetyltransferase [Shewanella sp. Isolate11]MCG9696690.1 GNAT family N-acetyltransferase [Shewanella sp. Isolate11]